MGGMRASLLRGGDPGHAAVAAEEKDRADDDHEERYACCGHMDLY